MTISPETVAQRRYTVEEYHRMAEAVILCSDERVLEVFREPENESYRRRSFLELGSRVTPEAWPDLELEVASLFPEIGGLAADDSHRAA